MIRNINDLKGFRVRTTDGEVGTVQDFYFDDNDWTVRYFVTKLDNELGGRTILIAPVAAGPTDINSRTIPLKINRDVIMNSPDIDTAKPISRQEEERIHNYYDWPVYWNPNDVYGLGVGDLSSVPMMELEADLREQTADAEEAAASGENVHLRSITEVTGYHVMARDETVGVVEDFLVDDRTWEIIYLIVDTNGILPGGKVIVSPDWSERVSWTQSMIFLDLLKEEIQNSPPYDPKQLPDRDYEDLLYEHYRRPKYWDKNEPLK